MFKILTASTAVVLVAGSAFAGSVAYVAPTTPVAVAPTPAVASAWGGYVEFTNTWDYDGGALNYSQQVVSGAIEFSLSNRVNIQIDALGLIYDWGDDPTEAKSIGGHLNYQLYPNVTVGAFYTYEVWNGPSEYQYYGVEAIITPGGMGDRLSIELVAGAIQYSTNPADPLLGIEAVYAVSDSINVSAGYLSGYDGTYNVAGVGVEYAMASGLYAALNYDMFIYPGSDRDYNIGLTVGYRFGGGATFGSRSWAGFYPGD